MTYHPTYVAPVFARGTKITDAVWDNIPAAAVGNWLWRRDYTPATEAKLAVIEGEGLYVRMASREKDPVSRHFEYGEQVWVDSAMEFFFSVREGGTYVNLEMNSAGNKLIGVGAGRDGRVPIDEYFPCPPVKAAVGPEGWRAECFFKKSDLDRVFGDFPCCDGAVLYGNFFKVGEETGRPHYGAWAAIDWPEPDFHRPEFFGRIEFRRQTKATGTGH